MAQFGPLLCVCQSAKLSITPAKPTSQFQLNWAKKFKSQGMNLGGL